MSLETLHTKAMILRARFDGLPITIAARLCGVDRELAASMTTWIRLHHLGEESVGSIPEHFSAGRAAPCFALLRIAAVRPGVFFGALAAAVSLPVLITLRWIH